MSTFPVFDPTQFNGDVDAYFARVEGRFADITPGVEKRVVWAQAAGQKTDWAVLYVHGFSASSEEIRPVPDKVAAHLGANIVYTRLQGHGRSNDAMAECSVAGWKADVSEAIAAAQFVGQRVLIVSTSTGGTLVAAAAHQPALMRRVSGLIFMAPNFAINSPFAPLLTLPAARTWLPLLAGRRRKFDVRNERHGVYWTTEYPSRAVFPVAELVREVARLDHGKISLPAQFWFSPADKVVRADKTADVVTRWGGPVDIKQPVMSARDDANAHVISGDILSPDQTDATIKGILDWIGGL